MRAQINENGILSVIPETSLESLALRVWWEDYMLGPRSNGSDRQQFAVLHIQFLAEKLPDHDGLED